MNARQIKKRNKNSYYLGVVKAISENIQMDSEVLTITVIPVPIEFNQHNFAKCAKLGKKILTKYIIK